MGGVLLMWRAAQAGISSSDAPGPSCLRLTLLTSPIKFNWVIYCITHQCLGLIESLGYEVDHGGQLGSCARVRRLRLGANQCGVGHNVGRKNNECGLGSAHGGILAGGVTAQQDFPAP